MAAAAAAAVQHSLSLPLPLCVCVCVYDMCVCVCVSVFVCADRKIVGLSSVLDSHKTDCTSFEHWQRCLSFEDIFLTIKRNNICAFSKS